MNKIIPLANTMEFLTILILALAFIALYIFFLFVLLHHRNKHRLFEAPRPLREYGITVLVPAFNEGKTIAGTVESLFESDYPGLKRVIVINDGSKDNTKKVLEKLKLSFKRLEVINKPNSGKADSLNCALKMVDTELFAVVDADSYPKKDALSNIVGFFNDSNMGVVSSAILLRTKNKLILKIQNYEYDIIVWTRKLLDFVNGVFVAPGALSVYRTAPVKKFGGFDKTNITEDIEITWHLLHKGYKTAMALKSISYTEAPDNLRVLWNQRIRWGMGGIQTLIKYKTDFLKKGAFGMFIYPFVMLSILTSYIIVFLTAFIAVRGLIRTFFVAKYSLESHTLASLNLLNFSPSVLLLIGLSLFILSLFFFFVGMRLIDSGELKLRNVFNISFYLFIYAIAYPVVWIGAAVKMITRNSKW